MKTDREIELERKLAEQQAIWCSIWKLNPHLEKICGCEELTKLLEEAKRQAVPEGWQAQHIRQYMHNDGSGFVAAYDKDGIDAMLSPLATPEERKE